MKLIYIFAVIVINYAVIIQCQSSVSDCTSKGVNYAGFILNSTTSKNEYSFSAGTTQYIWNICAVSPTCNSKASAGSASCQLSSNTYRNTGSLSQGSFSDLANGAEGTQLIYTGGAICSNKVERTTKFDLQCSKGQPITILGASEASTCIYEIKLSGDAACARSSDSNGSGESGSTDDKKKGGIGGGWVFIIILICGTVLYIGVGSLVNAKVRHLHGKEIFPNYSFWSDFPGLLKDGILFIKGKVTGSKSSSGYQQV